MLKFKFLLKILKLVLVIEVSLNYKFLYFDYLFVMVKRKSSDYKVSQPEAKRKSQH